MAVPRRSRPERDTEPGTRGSFDLPPPRRRDGPAAVMIIAPIVGLVLWAALIAALF